mmetsp:Transcript_55359/g.154183  ORF Transcript_55359/g.154183 Transcript_55359/m.154183 type:complete len:134 (+) Transcript_55359:101-502(+)
MVHQYIGILLIVPGIVVRHGLATALSDQAVGQSTVVNNQTLETARPDGEDRKMAVATTARMPWFMVVFALTAAIVASVAIRQRSRPTQQIKLAGDDYIGGGYIGSDDFISDSFQRSDTYQSMDIDMQIKSMCG